MTDSEKKTGTMSPPRRKRIHQIGSLYLSVVLVLVIGFITSVINTRMLGPERYGDLKFVYGVFQFLATISTLGIFATGSQVLATLRENKEKRDRIVGALVVVALVMSLLFTLIGIVFAFIQPMLFGNDLGIILLAFSPTIAVFIFQPFTENVLQGENRIHELSLFRLLPGAIFAASLILFNLVLRVDLVLTLLLQFASGAGVLLVMQRRLKPSFTQIRETIGELWTKNATYGRQVYFGVLSGVATAYLSTFMISYFLDNTNVGYFALALTLTMPLMQVATVVGTTYFREFAQRDRIPTKVTIATIGISSVTLLLFFLLIRPVVTLVYTEAFATVAELASIIAVGSVLHGFGDYVNRFLGAHGKGKELRNGAIAVGVINVVGYYVLVRWLGVQGAAITKLIAGGTYCGMMVWYYRAYARTPIPAIADVAPTTAVDSNIIGQM